MNNKKGKSVVATIEARFGSSQIKGISCYIPPLTIIDNITRIPSILSIDLSNKGSGIVR